MTDVRDMHEWPFDIDIEVDAWRIDENCIFVSGMISNPDAFTAPTGVNKQLLRFDLCAEHPSARETHFISAHGNAGWLGFETEDQPNLVTGNLNFEQSTYDALIEVVNRGAYTDSSLKLTAFGALTSDNRPKWPTSVFRDSINPLHPIRLDRITVDFSFGLNDFYKKF